MPLAPHLPDALPPGAAVRLGTTRLWHQPERGNDGVNALAFAPDGRTLAALGYEDGHISLWGVPAGHLLRKWEADDADSYGHLQFSPCGRFLGLASRQGLSLWDPDAGRLLQRLIDPEEWHYPWVYGIAFSPDGRLLAAALWYTGTVLLWEISSGKRVAVFQADPQPLEPANPWGERSDFFNCVAFSADGKLIAAGGTYKIFLDPKGPEAEAILQQRRQSQVFHRSFTLPDVGVGVFGGKYFVNHRGRVRCWEVGSGRQVAQFEGHEFGVSQLHFLSDGRLISYADDGEVWVWDMHAGRWLGEIAPSAQNIHQTAVAFAREGCYALLSWPGYLGLISLLDGSEVRRFPVSPGWKGWRPLAVSTDARWVVTASGGRLDLWDATTGADASPAGRHTDDSVSTVRYTAGGRVATATGGDVILWAAETGEVLGQIRESGPLPAGALGGSLLAGTLALSPDGRRAACIRRFFSRLGPLGPDNLLTWDWQTGTLRAWEDTDVTAVAWTPDGDSLILATKQGALEALDLRTGHRDQLWDGIPGVQSVTMSVDGRLVAALDGSLGVHTGEWSPGGWRRQLDIPADARKPNRLGKLLGWLLFSPDGRDLALATEHGDVCLGPVDGPGLPVVFTTPPATDTWRSAFAIGFLPTGRLLVARSYCAGQEAKPETETIRVFDVTTRREVWASPPQSPPIGLQALAFSPDGRTLASGLSDGTTLLWKLDATSGEARQAMLRPEGIRQE
jgi:WD40 repeat protein